jgi:trehalose synthase-fused probable maltokinase
MVAGLLYDAIWEPAFAQSLLATAAGRRRLPGLRGALAGMGSAAGQARRPLAPRLVGGPQNNSSVVFGERLILKLLRRIDEGMSPELELGKFLAGRGFPHTPRLVGALEYHNGAGEPTTLAVLHSYVAHRASGRELALEALDAALGEVHRGAGELPPPSPCADNLLALAAQPSDAERALLGAYRETAALLGRRTAELHQALAGDSEDEAFAPESFTPFAQRALYQALRNLAGRTLYALRRQLATLPEQARADAEALLAGEAAILERFAAVLRRPIRGRRIRTHGDYHLEQVLHTADDLVIIDFEGEPSRPAAYRRLRHSPLQDVVAMVRSFLDAAITAAEKASPARPAAEQVAHAWAQCASAAFLRAYQETAAHDGLIPEGRDELELLLDVFLLERALYEVHYDLNNRPGRAGIALRGARMMFTAEAPT